MRPVRVRVPRRVRCAQIAVVALALAAPPEHAAAELRPAGSRAVPRAVVVTDERTAVTLDNGDRVVFDRTRERFVRVAVEIAGRAYAVDLSDCAPLAAIDTRTLSLDFADERARDAGSFTLLFDAGASAELRASHASRVQITYVQRSPAMLLVTRRQDGARSFTEDLCRWRTPAQEAERSRELARRSAHQDTMARGAALPTLELVRRFVETEEFWRQLEVAQLLDARRDPAIVRAAAPLLESQDRHVRANAAYVLGKQGDPRGFGALVAMLHDRSPRACTQGTPGPCTPLAQLMSDRYYAVHVLGLLGDPHAIEVLAPLVADREIGYKVPWALGRIGTRAAIPPLLHALDDPRPDVRVVAIHALQEMGARAAVPKLRTLVDDPTRSTFGELESVGEAARAAIRALERAPAPGVRSRSSAPAVIDAAPTRR